MPAENPIQGEASLVMDGKELTLVYDWRALARLSKNVGGNVNLFEPDVLAAALELGLVKHHGDIKARHILAASPPLIDAIAAFNMAMQRAYFGHREPPKDAQGKPADDEGAEPDRLDSIARALGLAFRAGIQPSEFWRLTPFETNVLLEAHAERVRDEYDAILFASWHTAVLTNAGSKIPPLKKLIQREPDPTQVNDGDDPDQIAAKQMMAAMLGATRAASVGKAKH